MSAPAPQEPHSETETRLLDAAESVFAERGFYAATTAAIAERAGLNKTLIHYYFRSKDGLFRTMMERIASKHAAFLEDFSNTDPVEALSRATQRFMRILADNPNYVRLCAYCALEGTRIHEDDAMLRELTEAATDAIQRGIDLGLFRSEDPRHVLITVEGMVRFFFEHEGDLLELWGANPNREQIIEERTQHVLRMLLHGLTPQDTTAANRIGQPHARGGNAT